MIEFFDIEMLQYLSKEIHAVNLINYERSKFCPQNKFLRTQDVFEAQESNVRTSVRKFIFLRRWCEQV